MKEKPQFPLTLSTPNQINSESLDNFILIFNLEYWQPQRLGRCERLNQRKVFQRYKVDHSRA